MISTSLLWGWGKSNEVGVALITHVILLDLTWQAWKKWEELVQLVYCLKYSDNYQSINLLMGKVITNTLHIMMMLLQLIWTVQHLITFCCDRMKDKVSVIPHVLFGLQE